MPEPTISPGSGGGSGTEEEETESTEDVVTSAVNKAQSQVNDSGVETSPDQGGPTVSPGSGAGGGTDPSPDTDGGETTPGDTDPGTTDPGPTDPGGTDPGETAPGGEFGSGTGQDPDVDLPDPPTGGGPTDPSPTDPGPDDPGTGGGTSIDDVDDGVDWRGGPGGAVDAPTDDPGTTDPGAGARPPGTDPAGEDVIQPGETYDPATGDITDTGAPSITAGTTGAAGATTQTLPTRDFVDATPNIPTNQVKEQLAMEVIQDEAGVDSLSTDQIEQVGAGAYEATYYQDGERVTEQFAISELGQEFFQEQATREQLAEQGLEPEDYTLIPTDEGVSVELTDQGLVDEEFREQQLQANLGEIAADLGLDREDIRVTDDGEIALTAMGRGEVGRDVRTELQERVQERRAQQDRIVETTQRGWNQFRADPDVSGMAQARFEARQQPFRKAAMAPALTEERRQQLREDFAESIEEQAGKGDPTVDITAEDVELRGAGDTISGELTESGVDKIEEAENPVLGDAVGTTELFGVNLEDDIVDPATEFASGVGKGAASVVSFPVAAGVSAAGYEELGEDIYTGARQGGAGLGELFTRQPVELAEGIYAGLERAPTTTDLLTGDIAEAGSEWREYQDAVGRTAATKVSEAVEFAQEEPVQFASGLAVSLPLSYGAFRAASQIGPRTNLATRAAIQPGEEILFGAARASGLSSRVSSAAPFEVGRIPGVGKASETIDPVDAVRGRTPDIETRAAVDDALNRVRADLDEFMSDTRAEQRLITDAEQRTRSQDVREVDLEDIADVESVSDPDYLAYQRMDPPAQRDIDLGRQVEPGSELESEVVGRTGPEDVIEARQRYADRYTRSEAADLTELAQRQEATIDEDELPGVEPLTEVDSLVETDVGQRVAQQLDRDVVQDTVVTPAVDVESIAESVVDSAVEVESLTESRVESLLETETRLETGTETRQETRVETGLETGLETRTETGIETRIETGTRLEPPRRPPVEPGELFDETEDDDYFDVLEGEVSELISSGISDVEDLVQE